ncbi:MAG: hypothetical protein BWK79_06670 [Beggiatoa sp. IS2]|nr:MAG: hypothetical protein BWK79_06670 [Beggiatoa sp. IS2]
MNKMIIALTITLLSLLHAGCGAMLPSIDKITKSPWQSFEEAKKSFDKIIPEKTTTQDLKQLGFDPFAIPNVKLITYLEVIQKFVPNQSVSLEDLPSGVRDCLAAKEICKGYEVKPQVLNSKRYGNVVLDLLNFRRKTVTTGWKFDALIVLKNDLVVYKLWGGEPQVEQFEDKRNPLGPFQEIGDVLKSKNF